MIFDRNYNLETFDLLKENIITLRLDDSNKKYQSYENINYVQKLTLINLVNLFNRYSLRLDKQILLFYNTQYNNYVDTQDFDQMLAEIFYVNENSVGAVRILYEKFYEKFEVILRDSSIFKTTYRDYILYILPFMLSLITFISFVHLLLKIKDYKIQIQNVFFSIKREDIEKTIRSINEFSGFTEIYKNQNVTMDQGYMELKEASIKHSNYLLGEITELQNLPSNININSKQSKKSNDLIQKDSDNNILNDNDSNKNTDFHSIEKENNHEIHEEILDKRPTPHNLSMNNNPIRNKLNSPVTSPKFKRSVHFEPLKIKSDNIKNSVINDHLLNSNKNVKLAAKRLYSKKNNLLSTLQDNLEHERTRLNKKKRNSVKIETVKKKSFNRLKDLNYGGNGGKYKKYSKDDLDNLNNLIQTNETNENIIKTNINLLTKITNEEEPIHKLKKKTFTFKQLNIKEIKEELSNELSKELSKEKEAEHDVKENENAIKETHITQHQVTDNKLLRDYDLKSSLFSSLSSKKGLVEIGFGDNNLVGKLHITIIYSLLFIILADDFNNEDDDITSSKNDTGKTFKKDMLDTYIKIIVIMLLICSHFVVSIALNNTFSNKFLNNATDLNLLSGRAWNFNNMLIFFRESIVNLSVKSNKNLNYSDYSLLYNTEENLSSLDLFYLYFNKSFESERKISSISLSSTFFESYLNDSNILNSNKFCDYIQNLDYKPINNNITCNKKLDLLDWMQITYIDIRNMINQYEQINDKSYTDINNYLLSYNITQLIDNTELFISKGLKLGIKTQFKVISLMIETYKNTTIIRTIIFLILCVIMSIMFFIIASFLKELINKNKAILTIIPNEIIIGNIKVQEALQFLSKSS